MMSWSATVVLGRRHSADVRTHVRHRTGAASRRTGPHSHAATDSGPSSPGGAGRAGRMGTMPGDRRPDPTGRARRSRPSARPHRRRLSDDDDARAVPAPRLDPRPRRRPPRAQRRGPGRRPARRARRRGRSPMYASHEAARRRHRGARRGRAGRAARAAAWPRPTAFADALAAMPRGRLGRRRSSARPAAADSRCATSR